VATVSDGRFFLRLYVAGANARSRDALKRIFHRCEEEQKGNYELEVIDVYQQPELARKDQIVATPTLVRFFPMPVRRYIGNLSDTPGLFGEPNPTAKAP
jgi:circadian clock protein KaiB